MTDQPQNPSPEGDEQAAPETETSTERPEGDNLLHFMLGVVNASPGASANITLLVGGQLVSGWLIGQGDYFRGVAKEMEATFGSADLARFFEEEAADFDKTAKAGELAPRKYLHLRDARFVSSAGQLPSNRGVFWRCRITAIDGFNLGVLEVGTQ